MLRTPRWFVCIWKHTFPLIYRCMGLCNEYSTLQYVPPHPNDWLSMRSSASHRSSPPSGCSSCPWSNLAGAFFTWHSSRSVSSMYLLQLLTLSSNSSPLLFVSDKDPPLDSLPLDLLISAGFGTKSHLGETTCQLRWVFSQKKPLLPNICLLGSKTFLLSPLNLLSLFLLAYPSLFFSANQTFHPLSRNYTKCSSLLRFHVPCFLAPGCSECHIFLTCFLLSTFSFLAIFCRKSLNFFIVS